MPAVSKPHPLSNITYRKANRFGGSFVEIIVSMVILALVISGLANLFVAVKRYTLFSRSRSTVAELSNYWLAELNNYVRQDQYDVASGDYESGNPLRITPPLATPVPETVTLDSIVYTASYQEVLPLPDIFPDDHLGRKVALTITWEEPGMEYD